MYVIRAKSSKVQANILKTLSSSPKTTTSYGSVTGRIQKKGKYWQYYVTGGDRIIYQVIEKPTKTVFILFAGNHNEASIFLRNN